jgi:hypothetical protein
MSGSFLDTTIVVDLSDKKSGASAVAAEIYITANQPAGVPYYALRELLAGHVHTLCDAHNVIKAAGNPAEALLALLNRSPAEGRKREGKISALASAMAQSFSQSPTGSRDELKAEILQSLAIRVNQIWRRAHKLNSVALVQPLGCFNQGSLTYGSAGELRGPGDSFNCLKSERCAAAEYLFDDKSALAKLIEALHPDNLDAQSAGKNENQKRRKALKELSNRGPKVFNKGRCRALGDAYFAVMCPPGSDVLTTNIQDHLPLCNALGKRTLKP